MFSYLVVCLFVCVFVCLFIYLFIHSFMIHLFSIEYFALHCLAYQTCLTFT